MLAFGRVVNLYDWHRGLHFARIKSFIWLFWKVVFLSLISAWIEFGDIGGGFMKNCELTCVNYDAARCLTDLFYFMVGPGCACVRTTKKRPVIVGRLFAF